MRGEVNRRLKKWKPNNFLQLDVDSDWLHNGEQAAMILREWLWARYHCCGCLEGRAILGVSPT